MPKPTYEELQKQLAETQAKLGAAREFKLKVSEKGGVSAYGLGRFPVTLYYEQWTMLLAHADELAKFLEENKAKLKLKT